jgi:hypothetical protein
VDGRARVGGRGAEGEEVLARWLVWRRRWGGGRKGGCTPRRFWARFRKRLRF